MRLFHGTRQRNIIELRPSRGGEYGPGIYLTPWIHSAWFYATHVAMGTDKPLVLEVEVEIDPQKVFETTKQEWLKMTAGRDRGSVQKKLMKKGYQAISSTGLSGSDLQFVLFDPTLATILGEIHEHVGGSKRKVPNPRVPKNLTARKKRGRSSVGSTFDPACAFDEGYPWARGDNWLHALGDEYSYLLICALVERFALPIFLKERPRAQRAANTIREAIALGRKMAHERSASPSDLQRVTNALEEYRQEDAAYIRTLPPRPVTMEYEAAKMCLYAASYCVHVVPDVPVAYSYTRYAIDIQLRNTPDSEKKFEAAMAKVDEVGREFLRLAFQQAESFSYEEGYPTLTGKDEDVVRAHLYRKNMIHLANTIRHQRVSDLIDAKLSMADEVMRSLDTASVYLSNRGVKPSFWKVSTIDNKASMMAWQVLLNNNRSHFYSEVIGQLRVLPRFEDTPPKRPKKDKIGGLVPVEELLVGDWSIPYDEIRTGIQYMTHKYQRLFLADCAEHVLKNFNYTDRDIRDLPRLCIQAARDYANGKISELDMLRVGERLFDNNLRAIERDAREAVFNFIEPDPDVDIFDYPVEPWPEDVFGTDPRLSYFAASSAANTTIPNNQLQKAEAAEWPSDYGENLTEMQWQRTLLLKYLRRSIDQAMLDNSLPRLTGDDISITKATLLRAQVLDVLAKMRNSSLKERLQAEIAEEANSERWVRGANQNVPKASPLEVFICLRNSSSKEIAEALSQLPKSGPKRSKGRRP